MGIKNVIALQHFGYGSSNAGTPARFLNSLQVLAPSLRILPSLSYLRGSRFETGGDRRYHPCSGPSGPMKKQRRIRK
jgi:hypothetical protein